MPRTASQMIQSFQGKTALLTVLTWKDNPGMDVSVECLDCRISFGQEEVLVRPTTGEGATWVRADRLKIGVTSK